MYNKLILNTFQINLFYKFSRYFKIKLYLLKNNCFSYSLDTIHKSKCYFYLKPILAHIKIPKNGNQQNTINIKIKMIKKTFNNFCNRKHF